MEKQDNDSQLTISIKKEQELTPQQIRAIPFIAKAKTETEGCQNAGISRTALFQWKKNPSFVMALNEQRQEMVNMVGKIFQENMQMAAEYIINLISDPNADRWLKFSAAKEILNLGKQIKHASIIEERLDKLERVIIEKRTYK